MLILSALLCAASPPAHAAEPRRDLQIAPLKDDFAVYDAETWISPSAFAELVEDEPTAAAMRRQTARRQTLVGLGVGSTAIASGGLLVTSLAMFIAEDWRYSWSIRDPLFGDPGPPYARDYGPARRLLKLSTGTALMSVGIGVTGLRLRSRSSTYSTWYTPERAEELLVTYNDNLGAAAAPVRRPPLKWELVENDQELEVHRISGGGTVSPRKLASLTGDVETVERIKRTQRVTVAVGASAIAAGVLIMNLASDSPDQGTTTIAGVGIIGGGAVLLKGRRKVRSMETWYSTEEIEARVEAYNATPAESAALPPAEVRELALQLGVVPGGLGLAARF